MLSVGGVMSGDRLKIECCLVDGTIININEMQRGPTRKLCCAWNVILNLNMLGV